MVVSAWAVHDLPNMVLPPCHYGFQVYTRELSKGERIELLNKAGGGRRQTLGVNSRVYNPEFEMYNIPTRAISLMWNQRSVDTPLGLPFNIASYGLLLEIIAKEVNMVPDELIGNLGDTHIYLNQIEGIKEQLTREPFDLPTLKIEDEVKWKEGDCLPYYSPNDFTLENYQSHPTIKLPLSN
jgi:thymidylate synthase